MTPLHQNKNILTHGGCFFTDQDKITCRTISEGIKQVILGVLEIGRTTESQ
jgi:hypothetical protein